MRKVFFDTSALVPVVSEQFVQHPSAHARFVQEMRTGSQLYCSSHTLAECYATLTAVPLPRRISGKEANRLIEANFLARMTVVDLKRADYQKALRLCADRGRTSGQIYDVLHFLAALKSRCEELITYNLRHFQELGNESMAISPP